MKTRTSGQGRKKGAINKVTREVREVVARVAESTAPEIEQWLRVVANDDPGRALDLWLKMIEYHIPKLARTEMTGQGGGAVKHEHDVSVRPVMSREEWLKNHGIV